MTMHSEDEESLMETLELLLEASQTKKVQVVVLPALLEDIIHELRFLEERIATYKQSLLWYGGKSSDVRPLININTIDTEDTTK